MIPYNKIACSLLTTSEKRAFVALFRAYRGGVTDGWLYHVCSEKGRTLT